MTTGPTTPNTDPSPIATDTSAPVISHLSVKDYPTVLEKELGELINRNSLENGSNTPDFILATLMLHTLRTWNAVTNRRDEWFQNRSRVGGPWPSDHITLQHQPDWISAEMLAENAGPFDITLRFKNPAKGREILEDFARTFPESLEGFTIQDVAQRKYPNKD